MEFKYMELQIQISDVSFSEYLFTEYLKYLLF